MVAHESYRVVDGVRHDGHEDVTGGQQHPVEGHAADRGGEKVRECRRVKGLYSKPRRGATRAGVLI